MGEVLWNQILNKLCSTGCKFADSITILMFCCYWYQSLCGLLRLLVRFFGGCLWLHRHPPSQTQQEGEELSLSLTHMHALTHTPTRENMHVHILLCLCMRTHKHTHENLHVHILLYRHCQYHKRLNSWLVTPLTVWCGFCFVFSFR